MKSKKHIICFSGGHASAIVAIEAERKYGKENVILLNHDIHPHFEDEDIKRFKKEVSDYLGIPITYANEGNQSVVELIKNQFEVCIEKGSFVNPHGRQILCTFVLKTEPFYNFLKNLDKNFEYVIYYGFDENEFNRVERRKSILEKDGYVSDFPLAIWLEEQINAYNDYLISSLLKTFNKVNNSKINIFDFKMNHNQFIQDSIKHELIKLEEYKGNLRTIFDTEEIGIKRPNQYKLFKHANCKGCLKAGQQHWYVIYCFHYDIFELGKEAEEIIGYSFGKEFLKDIEPKFKKMKEIGIPASEHIPSSTFWKSAKKYLTQHTQDLFPCECFENV